MNLMLPEQLHEHGRAVAIRGDHDDAPFRRGFQARDTPLDAASDRVGVQQQYPGASRLDLGDELLPLLDGHHGVVAVGRIFHGGLKPGIGRVDVDGGAFGGERGAAIGRLRRVVSREVRVDDLHARRSRGTVLRDRRRSDRGRSGAR
jgi:hypothetical protein